jgi:hypothetical protein
LIPFFLNSRGFPLGYPAVDGYDVICNPI